MFTATADLDPAQHRNRIVAAAAVVRRQHVGRVHSTPA